MDMSSRANLKPPEKDESRDNIPPASMLVESCLTAPAPSQNINGNPRLSGPLTPMFKYFSIEQKNTSTLLSNSPTKPDMSASALSMEDDKENYALRNEHLTLLELTPFTMNMTTSLLGAMTPVELLWDEVLPEGSVMDDTWDTSRHGALLLNIEPNPVYCENDVLKNSAEKADIPNMPGSLQESSVVGEKEASMQETTHDCTPEKRPSLESSESDTVKSEVTASSEKMSTAVGCNLTHSMNSGGGISDTTAEDAKKMKLQITQDVSMNSTVESQKPVTENSSQLIFKTQPASDEDPVNITQDLRAANASDPTEVSPCIGMDSNVIYEENRGTTASLHSTFTAVQGNAAAQVPMPQNQTLDLSSMKSSPSVSLNPNTEENISPKYPILNEICTDSKSSQSSDIQRNLTQTFEKDSLEKSSGSTMEMQPGGSSASLQDTSESKLNKTITLKDTDAMTDKLQDSLSSFPVTNVMSAEPNLQKSNEKILAPSASSFNPEKSRESTLSMNAEEPVGSSTGEVKDCFNNGTALCELILKHNRKSGTFNLDDSLDLKPNPLVASTPLSTNKPFNFAAEKEGDSATGAQKRLYGAEPSKPAAQVSSKVPSNIVCDRKTFLRQPAMKPNMLSAKPPLLSKFKPVSLLPKYSDLLTSSHSSTRQIEAPKTSSVRIHQHATVAPFSDNLRSTAAGVKPSVSGLQRSASGCLPVRTHTTGLGLKRPQAKGTSAAPSCSDKTAEGSNFVKTTLPSKKHGLPHGDEPPTAKKKKTVASSDAAAASTSRVRTLRPPTGSLKAATPKPLSCAYAQGTSFELLLKQKDDEIDHLKEEILRMKKIGCPKCRADSRGKK